MAKAWLGCGAGKTEWHGDFRDRAERVPHPMRNVIAWSALLMLVAGCAGLYRTAGDRAFCESEPTDSVERRAHREICR